MWTDAFGVATVTVTVDDGGAADNLAVQSFVLTVNRSMMRPISRFLQLL